MVKIKLHFNYMANIQLSYVSKLYGHPVQNPYDDVTLPAEEGYKSLHVNTLSVENFFLRLKHANFDIFVLLLRRHYD